MIIKLLIHDGLATEANCNFNVTGNSTTAENFSTTLSLQDAKRGNFEHSGSGELQKRLLKD